VLCVSLSRSVKARPLVVIPTIANAFARICQYPRAGESPRGTPSRSGGSSIELRHRSPTMIADTLPCDKCRLLAQPSQRQSNDIDDDDPKASEEPRAGASSAFGCSIDRQKRILAQLCGLICKIHIHSSSAMPLLRQRACRSASPRSPIPRRLCPLGRERTYVRTFEESRNDSPGRWPNFVKLPCRGGEY